MSPRNCVRATSNIVTQIDDMLVDDATVNLLRRFYQATVRDGNYQELFTTDASGKRRLTAKGKRVLAAYGLRQLGGPLAQEIAKKMRTAKARQLATDVGLYLYGALRPIHEKLAGRKSVDKAEQAALQAVRPYWFASQLMRGLSAAMSYVDVVHDYQQRSPGGTRPSEVFLTSMISQMQQVPLETPYSPTETFLGYLLLRPYDPGKDRERELTLLYNAFTRLGRLWLREAQNHPLSFDPNTIDMSKALFDATVGQSDPVEYRHISLLLQRLWPLRFHNIVLAPERRATAEVLASTGATSGTVSSTAHINALIDTLSVSANTKTRFKTLLAPFDAPENTPERLPLRWRRLLGKLKHHIANPHLPARYGLRTVQLALARDVQAAHEMTWKLPRRHLPKIRLRPKQLSGLALQGMVYEYPSLFLVGHELAHTVYFYLRLNESTAEAFEQAAQKALPFWRAVISLQGSASSANATSDPALVIAEGWAELWRHLLQSPTRLASVLSEQSQDSAARYFEANDTWEKVLEGVSETIEILATEMPHAYKAFAGAAAYWRVLANAPPLYLFRSFSDDILPARYTLPIIDRVRKFFNNNLGPEIIAAHLENVFMAQLFNLPTSVARLPAIGPVLSLVQMLRGGFSRFRLNYKDLRSKLDVLRALIHYSHTHAVIDAMSAAYGIDDVDNIGLLVTPTVRAAIEHMHEEGKRSRAAADKTVGKLLTALHTLKTQGQQSITVDKEELTEDELRARIDIARNRTRAISRALSFIDVFLSRLRSVQPFQRAVIVDDSLGRIRKDVGEAHWLIFQMALQAESFLEDLSKRTWDSESAKDALLRQLEAIAHQALEAARTQIGTDKYEYLARRARLLFQAHLLLTAAAGWITFAEFERILESHKLYAPLWRADLESSVFTEDRLAKGLEEVMRPDRRGIAPRPALYYRHDAAPPWIPLEEATALMLLRTYQALYVNARNATFVDTMQSIAKNRDLPAGLRRLAFLQAIPLPYDVSVEHNHIPQRIAEEIQGKIIEQYETALNRRLTDDERAALGRSITITLGNRVIMQAEPTAPHRIYVFGVINRYQGRGTKSMRWQFYQTRDPLLYHLLSTSPRPVEALEEVTAMTGAMQYLFDVYQPHRERFRRLQTQNIVYLLRNIPRDMITAAILSRDWLALLPGVYHVMGIFRTLSGTKPGNAPPHTALYVKSYLEQLQERRAPRTRDMLMALWKYATVPRTVDRAVYYDTVERWLDYQFPGVAKWHRESDVFKKILGTPFVVLSILGFPLQLANQALLFIPSLVGFTPENTELAPRDTAYLRTLSQKLPEVVAIYNRDVVTGNFATYGVGMIGSWLKLVPFANARWQIMRQAYEAFTSADPQRNIRAWMGLAAVGGITVLARLLFLFAYWMANGDDDTQLMLEASEDRPFDDQLRSSPWGAIRMPNGDGLPGALSALAINATDAWMLDKVRAYKDKPEFAKKRFIEDTITKLHKYFVDEALLAGLVPPEAKTLVELTVNYSFFSHREIVPEFIQHFPPEDISPPLTPRSFEEVSRLLRQVPFGIFKKITPAHINYWARGTFGYLVADHVRLVEKLLSQGQLMKTEEWTSLNEIPFVRYMIATEPLTRYTYTYLGLYDYDKVFQRITRAMEREQLANKRIPPELIESYRRLSLGHELFRELSNAYRDLQNVKRVGRYTDPAIVRTVKEHERALTRRARELYATLAEPYRRGENVATRASTHSEAAEPAP